jgi:septum formation inhibitor MinC
LAASVLVMSPVAAGAVLLAGGAVTVLGAEAAESA